MTSSERVLTGLSSVVDAPDADVSWPSTALASRTAIAMATGLLMHEYQLNGASALEVLHRRAGNADVEVVELAEKMVAKADRAGRGLPPAADC